MMPSESELQRQQRSARPLEFLHTRHTFSPSQATGPGLTEVDVVVADKRAWDAWPEKTDRQWSVRDHGSHVVAVAFVL